MDGLKLADEASSTRLDALMGQFDPGQEEAARLFGAEAFSGLAETKVILPKAENKEPVILSDLEGLTLTREMIINRAGTVKDSIDQALKNQAIDTLTGQRAATSEEDISKMMARRELALKLL